jgi:uncharacterized membrane protein
MSEKRFSIHEAIKFGWDTMKGNAGFLIVLLIIAFLIENLPGIIAKSVRNDLPVASSILYLTGWLLGFIVQMGLIKVCLKFCDGIKGQLDDLLSSFNLLATFAVGSVLYFLIILGGLILLIIPGIIWGIKFSFYSYFIVDKGLGPLQALKASAVATVGAKWDLFLLGLLLLLINLAGALCFLVGLLATVPTSMIAYAYVYRKLSTGKAATGPAAEMYSI